jgi:acyl carrier protein
VVLGRLVTRAGERTLKLTGLAQLKCHSLMGLDSVEIVFELESVFEIRIPDRAGDRLWRVRDFEDLVVRLRHEQLPAEVAASVSDPELRQVVRDVIAREMALPLERVTPDAYLVKDLGIDA